MSSGATLSVDEAVGELKHNIAASGDLLLAGRLKGLQGLEAISKIIDIIMEEIIPQCQGAENLSQLVNYLRYLISFSDYVGRPVRVAEDNKVHMFLPLYDRLADTDPRFNQSSDSPMGSIRSQLLRVLILHWAQTLDQEEANEIFQRVRKTAKETDRKGLEEIKDLVRKHDGDCPSRRVELAIINAQKDFSSQNLKELVAVLSHRWVKGLRPDQVLFLSRVGWASSVDTGTWEPLVQDAVLRATDQIREACNAAVEIFIQLTSHPLGRKTQITCLSPGEVCARVDLEGDLSQEEWMKARDYVVSFIQGNKALRFQDLVCRVFVGKAGDEGAFEGRVTWNNWQATSRKY